MLLTPRVLRARINFLNDGTAIVALVTQRGPWQPPRNPPNSSARWAPPNRVYALRRIRVLPHRIQMINENPQAGRGNRRAEPHLRRGDLGPNSQGARHTE